MRQVVGIDREALDSRTATSGHGPGGERAMEQWHQRLRQAAGEWLEAIAQAGTEDESLIHGVDLRGD